MIQLNKCIIILVMMAMCSLYSCVKDEPNEVPESNISESASQYLPIKKGNYWLAQKKIQFLQSNNFTAFPSYDSIYVSEDTLINGVPHIKLLTYRYEISNGQKTNEKTNIFALLKVKDNKYLYSSGDLYFTTDTITKATYSNEVQNNVTLTSITGKAYKSGPSLKWEVKTVFDKSVFNTSSNLSREDGSFYLEKNRGFTKRIIHGDLSNPTRDRVEYHVFKSQIH